MKHFEHEEQFDENVKSRTALKNEMLELQAIGKKLTELNNEQIKRVPMSEELSRAIEETKRIKQREATRRHFQYLGKLMRSEDINKIRDALDIFENGSVIQAQALHKIEKLREALINGDKASLSTLIENTPNVDVTHLRQLIRNAQKEKSQQKNLGSAKKLFKYLKELEAYPRID